MKWVLVKLAAFVLATWAGAAAAGDSLSPELVKQALATKKAVRYEVKTPFSMKKNSFGGESIAFVSTAYSRLTWLAQGAREKFEELTPEQIEKAAADTQVCVSSGTSELKVQAIVLVPRNIDKPTPKDVVKPAELSVDIVDMYNKLGGQWKEANYTACFPLSLPYQDLDVLVVYADNARKHETALNKQDFRGHFPKDMK